MIYLLSLFTADFKFGLIWFLIKDIFVFTVLGILLTLIVIFTNRVKYITNVWLVMAYGVFKVYEIVLVILNWYFWTFYV